jgi:MFS family permease
LALTALAAFSPSFWWFVAIVALSRPLLSAAKAVGAVVAGEETTTAHRTRAMALAIAGYGIGVGLVTVVRVPISSGLGLGFRGLFALALVPLFSLPLIARLLEEPDRFLRLRNQAQAVRRRPLADVRPDLRGRLLVVTGVSFAVNFVTGPANTFLFFYAEGSLGITRAAMAGATIAAGVLGLLGLVVGRWAADRLGRRPACVLAHVLLTAGGVLLYSGTSFALFAGYLLSVLIQGAYGPAFGALSTEVFPTSNRATAQGWLTAASVLGAVAGLILFGAVSDAVDSYVVGALAVCVPCALAATGYLALPETRGLELEQTAPEISLS